ncbi:MAG: DUF222 domain-containing protein, partial [Acidimicrobiia bacterium]
MFDTSTLPADLASMVPGPELAVLLAGLDRDRFSGHDRVELLKARSRLVAHVQAELLADMVSVLDSETETLPADYAVHEIREVAASELEAALVWTRRAAESQLDFATTLVSDYPQLWRALHAGVIDLPKARVITGQTLHLEPDIRDQVVDQVLERAPDQTTGQLAARIRRLAISVDPESAKRRYEQGLEERKLTSEANNDGTDNLFGWHLPPGQTRAIMKRINRYALQLKTLGDGRTMDQIRADVF